MKVRPGGTILYNEDYWKTQMAFPTIHWLDRSSSEELVMSELVSANALLCLYGTMHQNASSF